MKPSGSHPAAKICLTAAGCLIHQDKILLIKHKKLGIWLCPGGHVDQNEMPHRAAEREFIEETGLRVRAVFPPNAEIEPLNVDLYDPNAKLTVLRLPSPISSNVHWISKTNYHDRIASNHLQQHSKKDPIWQKGCEMHYNQLFLMELAPGETTKKLQRDPKEIDDIGFFTQAEAIQLENVADTYQHELKLAFKVYSQLA